MTINRTNQTPPIRSLGNSVKIYCVCRFKRGAVVPAVELISARSDEQALALAQIIGPSAEGEVWDMNRLVARLPARLEAAPLRATD